MIEFAFADGDIARRARSTFATCKIFDVSEPQPLDNVERRERHGEAVLQHEPARCPHDRAIRRRNAHLQGPTGGNGRWTSRSSRSSVKAACGRLPASSPAWPVWIRSWPTVQARRSSSSACRPGAKAGLTIDVLGAWNGETADAAIEAWLEELVGFFPDARRREALQKAIQSLRDLGTKVMERGAAMLTPEAVDAAAEQTVAAIRQRLSASESGASSGNTPATSASIPDPTPSGNST